MTSSYPIYKIGIITKRNVAEKAAYLKMLVKNLEAMGKEVYLDGNASPLIKHSRGLKKTQLMSKVDMAIVLGGDGTLLKTARRLAKRTVLVLGVNMGRVGFLTELTPDKVVSACKKIFAGRFVLDERTLLRVTLYRKGKKIKTSLALNDAVINQGSFARLIRLKTEIDQRKLVDFLVDGLTIATPTGSTGHSLSAGGPIVHPRLEGLVLTPICPAKLSSRPIVIPNTRQLKVIITTERRDSKYLSLTIDGQFNWNLLFGDEIKIRKSSRTLHLIRFGGHGYYRTLRTKLGWGG